MISGYDFFSLRLQKSFLNSENEIFNTLLVSNSRHLLSFEDYSITVPMPRIDDEIINTAIIFYIINRNKSITLREFSICIDDFCGDNRKFIFEFNFKGSNVPEFDALLRNKIESYLINLFTAQISKDLEEFRKLGLAPEKFYSVGSDEEYDELEDLALKALPL